MPKDHSGCVHHNDIAALLLCNSPNIFVDVAFSDHRARLYSMIEPWIQLHTPLHVTILRDHVIWYYVYFADITTVTADITAGQRN